MITISFEAFYKTSLPHNYNTKIKLLTHSQKPHITLTTILCRIEQFNHTQTSLTNFIHANHH
ncbi:hypothetical protein LINGRAHAP2_LOCUS6824 [Linum grandiflorum]